MNPQPRYDLKPRVFPASNSQKGLVYDSNNTCFATINARSVTEKVLQISDLLIEEKIDFLLITETWLSNDKFDETVLRNCCPPGYTFINKPRLGKKGGGVAIIYRDSINLDDNLDIGMDSYESMECIIVKISIVKSCIVHVFGVYRPPDKPISAFLNDIKELFYKYYICDKSDEMIMLGDFNIRVDDDMDSAAVHFKATLSELGLRQCITKELAPNGTQNRGHILDLFVVRDDSSVVSSVIFSGIVKSDHLAVVVNTNLMARETQVLNKTEEKRQWSKLDVAQFKAMLGDRLGPINYKSVYDVN